mmetsp:Transcript_131869/g.320451  ORF Transcript_131869/g.320451 Transcript_131869/m.320451 type:complete len:350 (-) Transcript_131869:489-1538(-)
MHGASPSAPVNLLRKRLHLQGPPLLRVAQDPLQVLQAVGQGRLAAVVHLRAPLRRVPQQALQVLQPLRHGGVVRVPRRLVVDQVTVRLPEAFDGRAVILAICNTAMELLEFALVRLQLLLVPVFRVSQKLLHVLQALGERGVVRFPGLRLVLQLGMRAPERVELPRVSVHVVAKGVLEVVHALLQRGVVPVQLLHLGLVPRILGGGGRGAAPLAGLEPALEVVVLGLQLPRVLVRAVLQRPLQLLHAVRHRGVPRLPALGLLRQLPVRQLHGLQLAGVLVGRLAQELLHKGQPLLQGRMVGVPRLPVLRHDAAEVLLLCRAAVSDPTLQVLELGVRGGQCVSVLVGGVA